MSIKLSSLRNRLTAGDTLYQTRQGLTVAVHIIAVDSVQDTATIQSVENTPQTVKLAKLASCSWRPTGSRKAK